jgi:dTDP-glucose 4,6-dehydratase
MKRVLITGGAGFIGSRFIHYLLRRDASVSIVNLDALTYAGNLSNLTNLPEAAAYTFVHGDIRDRELLPRLIRTHCIDTIIHFAAESHVDRSINDPGAFVQTNVVGTFNLLETARQVWLNEKSLPLSEVRFHHVSTDEVYGSLEPDDPPFAETTPYAPNSPYAASKAASDHLARAYHHTYGLPLTLTSCSNNYGPCQFPEKLIPLVIQNALEGRALPVYGDGGQIRDWLYVEDHCAAIYEVVTRGRVGETYNIGGNNQPTNLEIVRLLCAILDELLPDSPYRPRQSLITYVSDRPGHDRRYAMDSGKIERDLGWQPRETLASGLRRTVEWYLEHQDWVNEIRERGEYQGWMKRHYEARIKPATNEHE